MFDLVNITEAFTRGPHRTLKGAAPLIVRVILSPHGIRTGPYGSRKTECKPYGICKIRVRYLAIPTGRGSLTGSVSAWHASGPEFDPHVRHIFSWRLGHENISTAILHPTLIQEEQLSVTGERMCTYYR